MAWEMIGATDESSFAFFHLFHENGKDLYWAA